MILQEKLNSFDIILASQSPRRHQLLKNMGIRYRALVKTDIDETYPKHLKNIEIAEYLAQKKASEYNNELKSNTILITADTIVSLNDEILGKPTDKNDAVEMLKKLSGNHHNVITGICLKSINKEFVFSCNTSVYFKNLTIDEILYYIDNYKPFDKAGAYGVQEWIGYIGIERIEGSYFNVVGLPVQKLYSKLNNFIGS